MANWIAGTMAVLGGLMVAAGAFMIVWRNWVKPAPAEETQSFGGTGLARAKSFVKLEPPDRLIAWGILLLVIAAVAAGVITFSLGTGNPAK